MDQLSAPDESVFPDSMADITTPQKDYEMVDQMVLEAADIRRSAKKLETRALRMYRRSDILQEAAKSLQRQASRDRQQIAAMYETIIANFKDLLGKYEVVESGTLKKIALGVEEGRISLEQIESFAESLRVLQSSVAPEDRPENDIDPMTSPPENPVQHNPDENIQVNSSKLEYAEYEEPQTTTDIHARNCNSITFEFSDDEYQSAPADLDPVDVPSSPAKQEKRMRKRKGSQEIDQVSQDGEESSIVGQPRKRHKSRGQKQMLSIMSSENIEVPELDLDTKKISSGLDFEVKKRGTKKIGKKK